MTEIEAQRSPDILSLGMRADECRRGRPDGGVVTYLRVHVMTAGELAGAGAVPDAAAEVRLHELPGTLDEALQQVRRLREAAAGRRVAAYSLADVAARARGGWGRLDEVLRQMVTAGLMDCAEIPIDQIDDGQAALGAVVAAGITPARLTVSHPMGERAEALLADACRWLSGHPQPIRVAPLPRIVPADKPTTGYEDVRLIAVTRLACGQARAAQVSVEVDWSLYGPKLAQVALTFGADHLDAVAATTDASRGPRRGTVEDVERNIRAAGFEPREYRPRA